jgi:flavin-dependent dehydrogenase
MVEKKCDVLIVGGGPAGLATAIALRQRGADVLLADALAPPIDKACGEGILPDSRRDLGRLGVELPDACGARFHGIRFSGQRFSVAAEFPSEPGLGVKRTVLHQLLADRAAEAGVRLAWNTSVSVNPGQPIALDSEPVRYRYLIGADGQSSRVRTWAGLDDGSLLTRRFGFRIHYRIAPSITQRPRPHVEVHWTVGGQVYVTPVAENELCVSVMAASSDAVRGRQMVGTIPGLKQQLAGAEIITRERGGITTTRRLRSVTRGKVALVGDASGSADAITGEGLAMSFRQALLLAEAIDAGDLSLYESVHPTIMRLPQTMARILLLMDRWPALRDRALRVLAHDPALFQALVCVHIGEKPLRHFIMRQAPSLGFRLLMPLSA